MRYLAAFLATLLASPLSATTYYVSPTGSDSNNGTSMSTPFQTIYHCTISEVAGDTCYLLTGNYIWGGAGTQTTYIYPTISDDIASSVNYLQVDFFDPINSSTATYVDVIRTGTSNQYQQFRFGIDALGLYGTPVITGVTGALGPNQYTTIFTGTKSFGFLETYFQFIWII